jgi:glucose-1-phosphate cytidylyltransferase
MRYYAHFGHKDFILCLGHGGELIREFFLNYNECLSNDFVLSPGRKKIELLASDVQDWRITFVDTGLHSAVGERLLRVRRFLAGESAFLVNYSDGLSDLPLDRHIADIERRSVGRTHEPLKGGRNPAAHTNVASGRPPFPTLRGKAAWTEVPLSRMQVRVPDRAR